MTIRRVLPVLLAAAPSAGVAQEAARLEAGVMSDWRVRGMSWSDGRPAAQLFASMPLGPGLDLAGQATTSRGSARHGGADAVLDVSGGYSSEAGLLRWHGGVAGHFFPGGSGAQDYVDLSLGGGAALGPLDLMVTAHYAPSQAAIGRSNLYTVADARIGLMGTPLTLAAHLGRSAGSISDRQRSDRLRPGGRYTDWSLGLDYAIRRLFFSITYSDTSIDRRRTMPSGYADHAGATITFGARFIM